MRKMYMKSILLGLLLAFAFVTGKLLAQHTVSGIVKDQGNNPLTGALIQERESLKGTIADTDGKFILQVESSETVLVISFQGFKSQKISLNGKANLDITLEEDVRQLNDVVVTATRSARDLENVPQQVKVISRNEIENTIATDITDVMKKTAGVDVIQYPGLLSGVGIRGFRPQFSGINQRTLLLIDGRPAGATNLATIDMNNIERVEVLKGPASALYGAQAMGGVVNLITKKTEGVINGRIFGGLGNFGRVEGGFSTGGNVTEKLDFDLSFNSFTQGDDFRLGDGNLFRDAFGSNEATRILWTDNGKQEVPIDDARGDGQIRSNTSYQNYSGALRLGYDFNDDWRIDAKIDRFYAEDVNTPGDIENDDQNPGLKDLDRFGGDIILNGKLSQKNEITAKFFAATERNTRYRINVNDTTTIRTSYRNGENELNWIGAQIMDRHQLGDHFLTIGIDYNKVTQDNVGFNDRGEANVISAQRPNFNQENTGFYLQVELNFLQDRLNITAGIRNELIRYNITGTDLFLSRSETHNVVNPSIGINYNLVGDLYLHTTFGTAFTPVGAFEIAGYDERNVDENVTDGIDTVDVWQGNPELKNQRSQTFDIGVRYASETSGLSFDLTYFYTHFENNIITQVTQFPNQRSETGAAIRNLNTYTNAQGTTLSGLEFDINYYFPNNGIHLFANGVYILQAEEIREIFRQPQPLTLDMHNVADVNLNYGIGYEGLPWLSARLSGRYVGRRFDTDWSYYLSQDNGFGRGDYADVRYPAFMVMDFVATVKLKRNHLSLLAGNITDENYYEKRGFNLMGRNYMIRYSLNF